MISRVVEDQQTPAMNTDVAQAVNDYWMREPDPAAMMASWASAHRQYIVDAVAALQTRSLYEVGCGAGPNLRRLQYHFGDRLRLGGSDCNPAFAPYIKETIGIDVDQTVMPKTPNFLWHTVLTCYALSYVHPDILAVWMDDLVCDHLILLELHANAVPYRDAGLYAKQVADDKNHLLFVHDYATMLNARGWKILWRWPIWHDGLNQALVVIR